MAKQHGGRARAPPRSSPVDVSGSCCVIAVRNGSEALEEARRSPPVLIVSDLMMPVIDGAELFAGLRDWDARRLDQVFANVVTNALNYAPGKPIEVRILEGDDDVTLVVRDFGPGVAPDVRSTIFDRFDCSRASRNAGGLGLGLFISKQIVVAHGGHACGRTGGRRRLVRRSAAPRRRAVEFRAEQRATPRLAHIPVVVMSADPGLDTHDELLAARSYIRKPFDIALILAAAAA